jgi:hypothetical protein
MGQPLRLARLPHPSMTNHHAGIAQDRMIAAISKSVNITIEERELVPFCVLGPTLR